jgi:hypothetical protein
MIPSPHRRGRYAGPSAPKTLQSQAGPQPQKRPSVSRQPKAISFPTDAKLVHAAIKGLNRLAKKHGVGLRQSYLRIAKRAAMMAGRYAHAKQFKRHRRELRILRSRLGRIIRDNRRSWGPRGGVAMAPRTRQSDPLPAAAPARLQALFLPRSRGRVHRQGQGLSVLRVRRQGFNRRHQCPRPRRPVRAARQGAAGQPLRPAPVCVPSGRACL